MRDVVTIGRRAVAAAALVAAFSIGLAPKPAEAWWRGGWGWGWRPAWGVAVVPPVVVAPPPVVYAPPVAYAPGYRWIPGHYGAYGYWVPGHWGY